MHWHSLLRGSDVSVQFPGMPHGLNPKVLALFRWSMVLMPSFFFLASKTRARLAGLKQKSPQRGSVEPHRPKSATNGHSQHQARDGARANLAGLGARGPGAEGTYPPDYPSCARNPPRLPTLWPPTAFIMANWATCGRAERASKKARLPGACMECLVCAGRARPSPGDMPPMSKLLFASLPKAVLKRSKLPSAWLSRIFELGPQFPAI